jgi:sec-independent protein translocase protein TatA
VPRGIRLDDKHTGRQSRRRPDLEQEGLVEGRPMFGTLGAPELVLILVVVMLLFGTKRLPELGRSLGEGIRSFKKAMSDEPEDPTKKK